MKDFKRLVFQRLPLLGLLFLAAVACVRDKQSQPNFLVLISDDQRWDQLSYVDQPIIPELETPHLDQLANQGVYYTNAFVTTPICAVSRACIMTGRYVNSHGMNHFNTDIKPTVLQKTYPALLHENGYYTGFIGKWGMGLKGTEQIFDFFDGWPHQGSYFHQTDSGKIHNSIWLAERTKDFLDSIPSNKPFTLTVCFKAPHHPYQPDERDKNLFAETIIQTRKTDSPEYYAQLPAHIMDSSLNAWCYDDERGTPEKKDAFEKNFLRCVVSLDRGVGRIMQYFKEKELDQNTVTIFLSDHGYLWGEHGLGGKWLLYEESIRIPLIIHDPRLPKRYQGVKREQIALNIDVAPTVLDMAGIPIPAEINGVSLAPTLKSHDTKTHDYFLMEHIGVIDVETPIPDSRGIRNADWKYIEYLHPDGNAEELYDLRSDPYESQNLAADPKYQDKLEEFRKLINQKQ